jgi:hypothetical protein
VYSLCNDGTVSLFLYLMTHGDVIKADHGNFFRQTYFSSLLKHNIGLMIVCNPFYGKRKPKGQVSSYIRKVKNFRVAELLLSLT